MGSEMSHFNRPNVDRHLFSRVVCPNITKMLPGAGGDRQSDSRK